jgi:hypothetical protein
VLICYGWTFDLVYTHFSGYLYVYASLASKFINKKKGGLKIPDRPHYQLEITNRVPAVVSESTLRFLFLQALTWH